MKFIAIIPARYGSKRFPGKPLALINGKIMVQRVYEQALKAFEFVYVATEDTRIFDAVNSFGGNVVMTSKKHRSGTDRCAEAIRIISDTLKTSFDVVVNIQGDEPFIQIEQLNEIKKCFRSKSTQIATLIKPINNQDDIFNPNKPKVVINQKNEAIYFSRSPIPFIRGVKELRWITNHQYYKHIGLYAYRSGVLTEITKLLPSPLELAESLEQLRWIEYGYKIKTAFTEHESISVDTPKDLEQIRQIGLI
ncbi:MAG: 3-deoxy-manno-octulosonate cytidylyltransferase [Bacteroidales bacterium]|nr:3-deoxy-manno-octulosonate cytidylyltransferase [Bacteroidales bacterium]HOY37916.1 3-deoxy-manno-octulosonate cytidylyltransferase [Bacteroidales bacterium]HQP03504.1 3-deoxy-manno-octulosonate cytidylyltransferase [Bacteroidales bacterium]